MVCLLFCGCGSPDEPVVNEPATEPVAGEPGTDEPITVESTNDEPIAGEPNAYEPVAKEFTITTAGGSAANIRAAADTVYAAGGGTVYLPEGDFNLGGNVLIRDNVNLIGAGMDKTILRSKGSSAALRAQGDNIRISGLSLITSDGEDGILIYNCLDFRVDNCYIEGYHHAGVYVRGIDTRGVIDHCEIKMTITDSYGYGVYVSRSEFWEEDMRLGTEQATFIEDCVFVNARHAVASGYGAHYVFRYNIIRQGVYQQQVDAHGASSSSTEGTRCIEVYENVIEDPVSGTEEAMSIRGGGGVIFNNTITGYDYAIRLNIDTGQDLSSYPVYRQVHDLWIWNNSYDGLAEVHVPSLRMSDVYIQENRDYFLYAKPGYTPYTYPHPLTLGGGNNPPMLRPIGNKSVNEGALLQFTISAIDPDDDNLTYSASNLPPGASFDPATRTFSWNPNRGQSGTYPNVHFEVSDSALIDSEDINITVSLPPSLPLRVNTGGNEYIDSLGNSWKADQSYVSGAWGFYGDDYTVDRGIDHAISGTDDDRIYQTERYGLSGYRFDLGNGIYDVTLHFAETSRSISGAQQRVFDIVIGGKLVLDNLDIFSEVGGNTALIKTINNVYVTNGQLTIEFTKVEQQPEINGIEIFASKPNSPPALGSNRDRSITEGQTLQCHIFTTDFYNDSPTCSASYLMEPVLIQGSGHSLKPRP